MAVCQRFAMSVAVGSNGTMRMCVVLMMMIMIMVMTFHCVTVTMYMNVFMNVTGLVVMRMIVVAGCGVAVPRRDTIVIMMMVKFRWLMRVAL